ncbi:MAG: Bax inhibitor-1/YccA family protein [Magnetovibrio sp.]|nr:Bax inhibitor-1/YccA family protein [Magnetovibrio sp.]
MAFEPQDQTVLRTGSHTQTLEIDQGLRSYMLKVYNYMASGLALTGIVAMFAASYEPLARMFYMINETGHITGMTGLGWIITFAPLALVFVLSFGINRMSAPAAQGTFWFYSGLMGLSLSYIFFLYTGASITRVFFITAATFAGMSLYGYTTKRDLTGIGSFLIMGLIGLIIASVVNFFLQSSALHFVISAAGVLIFVGLTAYDTQKIKAIYNEMDGKEVATKKAIMGALTLYLDFINLFIMLLRLFGERR